MWEIGHISKNNTTKEREEKLKVEGKESVE